MKRLLPLLFILVCIPSILSAQKSHKLFNGKDFKGWYFAIETPGVAPEEVFIVKDGTIHITDKSFGYMCTDKSYDNYRLDMEWRCVGGPGNGGVFVNTQPTVSGARWPEALQIQVRTGVTGDVILMEKAMTNEHKQITSGKATTVVKKEDSNEKPIGEWNTLSILCENGTVTVYVNGLLQNKVTGATPAVGRIGIQAEQKTMEFRNLVLTPVKP